MATILCRRKFQTKLPATLELSCVMTDIPNHPTPAMISWKTYVQFAALRSRKLLSQRNIEPEPPDEKEIETGVDCRPRLLLRLPDGVIYFWLHNQQNWRIGRSKDCDIVLADQCVSRYHATVQRVEPGEFYLMDLNSYNGSFINGRRVREISRIHSGDRLNFGQIELEFYDGTFSRVEPSKPEEVTAELKSQSSRPMVR
jgi:hypothetical protein